LSKKKKQLKQESHKLATEATEERSRDENPQPRRRKQIIHTKLKTKTNQTKRLRFFFPHTPRKNRTTQQHHPNPQHTSTTHTIFNNGTYEPQAQKGQGHWFAFIDITFAITLAIALATTTAFAASLNECAQGLTAGTSTSSYAPLSLLLMLSPPSLP
jgi:hypothetical protein